MSLVLPHQRNSWKQLQQLADQGVPHLRELLNDESRSATLQREAAGLYLDFSRQSLTSEVLEGLLGLADEAGVLAQAQAMARGEPINATEHRAVLHMALRGSHWADAPWGGAVNAQVNEVLNRFCAFADALHQGRWNGHTGEAITDVVNIGIGGSDLGPRMAVQALDHLAGPHVRVHFVSNPDAWALHALLRGLKPARTLFIVASKTFTTQETMTIAASARRWLLDGGVPEPRLNRHLAAVSAAPDKAAELGVAPEQVFGFWDWVGGRYSVWSAVGLPLAVHMGSAAFKDFLAGAHAMDRHFLSNDVRENLPLLLALFTVWNRNFLGSPTQLISCYPTRLALFAPFIQQMDMESLGKRTHTDGSAVQIGTGAIVWGGLGIDAQHAYFQLLHQGTHRVPVDFIGVRNERTPLPMADQHHHVVNLNLRAQSQALALGRSAEDTARMLRDSGMSDSEVQRLTPHRSFAGNVPNQVLWMDDITPQTLGALIALYEHKVFCLGALWGIHAYDQWGVELGKTMAKDMEAQGH
jgi:glucose-6-phosphate isomerase